MIQQVDLPFIGEMHFKGRNNFLPLFLFYEGKEKI
jgi:hypothetical protein